MSRFVALLRGINVGGKNVIKMADLRTCFEELGFTEVETYIQSGNVVFSSRAKSLPALTRTLEKGLSESFRYGSRVCIVSADGLKRIVSDRPRGFGEDPGQYRYDVVFVMKPATAREALAQAAAHPDVDTVAAGKDALYFRRLISKAAQSHLPKLLQKPVYKHLTVRNWNTTTKLLELAAGSEKAPTRKTPSPKSRRKRA